MRSHTVLARLFGRQRLSFLQTIVNEEVDAILSGLEQRAGEWDAVADFAKPLPVSAAHCDERSADCRTLKQQNPTSNRERCAVKLGVDMQGMPLFAMWQLRVIIRALGFGLSDEDDLKRWADDVEEWFGGQGDVLQRFER